MKECSVCQSCFPDSVENCTHDSQLVKMTLPIETVIQGRYRLEKRLGQGSVSIVYFAYDLLLGTNRAVKIILPDLIGNDVSISERLLHEATATSAIHHANIVAVTYSGMLNAVVPFIVMEFVSGTSLQETLSISGALSPSEAFDYVSTIGSGLAAAHKLGIVHGDLKPRNILIAKDRALVEAIKIADFGLSQMKSGKLYGPLAVPKSTGMLRSPLYLAPEEWSDSECDSRADIYSLGIILYQMLAGEVPFKGRSTAAIMKQHLMNPPPSLAGPSGSISSELEAVVLHALQKDPAERPATVEQFVEELRFAVKGPGTSASVRSASGLTKKVRRSFAKVRESAEQDQAAAAEAPGRLTEARDSQQFLAEITLANSAAFEEVNAPPQIDLDQTIVISKPPADGDKPGPAGTKIDIGADPVARHQPVVTEPGEIDLDMTILPGMIGYQPLKRPSEPLESPGEPRVDIENDEQLSRDPEAVSVTDEMQHSAFSNPSDEEAELPRSIPPVLLAAGVILIMLLIGIGVYYSRVPQ
jgi:serine/threonine protein kinase